MNKHPKMDYLYVGVDCHKYTHTASVINCFNEPLGTVTFNNQIKDFKLLMDLVNNALVDYPDTLLVFGLEDVKHFGRALCTYLLKDKYLVKFVNASLTFNERKSNPIITKTDELDSLAIAKVLLDKFDTLPDARNDEIFWTLKQLVTARDSLVKTHTHYKNKLHSQLLHHYPNYRKIFSCIDGKTALNFFSKYPSPNLLKGVTREQLLKDIRPTFGGNNAIKKVNLIFSLITDYTVSDPDYQEERNILIQLLVKYIIDNDIRITELEKEVIDIYDRMDCKLHTMPGLTKVSAAVMLAEIGNIARFKSSSQLARYSGIAPNSFSSGTSTKYVDNQYGNRRLNALIYFLAVRNICPGSHKYTPTNPIFIEYFNKKVSQGKTKKMALVCVMRRQVNIIYGILKNRTEYTHPQELHDKCKSTFLDRFHKEQEEKQKQAKEKEKIKK